jgi:uncharacterized iron-regulated protein
MAPLSSFIPLSQDAHVIGCLFVCAALSTSPAVQDSFTVYSHQQPATFDAMLDALAKADVVFVGEIHDQKQGHAMELAILKGLYSRSPRMAFGLEMFERDVQLVLDEYLAGQITDSSFLAASRPWPNYKTDYAPLITFCRDNHLPVVATNAPRRYVNMVSRNGQGSLLTLSREARSYFVPVPYSMEIPAGYDRALTDVFAGPHDQPAGTAPPPGMPTMEHLKEAQGMWDSTMADSIVGFLRHHRMKLMHINGSMHSDSRYGIVDRLLKRQPKLRIMNVTIRPSAHYPQPPEDVPDATADFIIVTPPDPPAPK